MLGQEKKDLFEVRMFKAIVDNPLTKGMLRLMSRHCKKDDGSHLEIALGLYTESIKKACIKCKTTEKIVSPIVKLGAETFGTTQEKMKERFKDRYWRRGLANVLKGIGEFGVRRPYVPGAPFQVVWNITKRCNLKCKHCYENAGLPAADELTTEEVKKGLDILAEAGVLINAFSGGEPTTRPDILELIKHSDKRGVYTAMATNAILLADRKRVKELKESGLRFAQISLDGIDPKTHDEFRGLPGAFQKTIQGIKNCVEEELFVEIATTATHYNFKEIPRIIDFAEEQGVDWLMIYNFVPAGRGKEIVNADLTPEEREELLSILWDRMKAKKIEVLSTAPQFSRVAQQTEARIKAGMYASCDTMIVPTHFYNPELSGQLKRLAEFIGGCGAGRFYLGIEPNGDIYPCVFFPYEDSVKVGNLLEDDFQYIWKNSRLLKEIRNKDILEPHCGVCDYRYTCGGCRARAYGYFKNYLAPDPGCINNKENWEKMFL